jgi:hypothetical protein
MVPVVFLASLLPVTHAVDTLSGGNAGSCEGRKLACCFQGQIMRHWIPGDGLTSVADVRVACQDMDVEYDVCPDTQPENWKEKHWHAGCVAYQTDCLVYDERSNSILVQSVTSEAARQVLNQANPDQHCSTKERASLVLCKAAEGQKWGGTMFIDPHHVTGLTGNQGQGAKGGFCKWWNNWGHIKDMAMKAQKALPQSEYYVFQRVGGQVKLSCEKRVAKEVRFACCKRNGWNVDDIADVTTLMFGQVDYTWDEANAACVLKKLEMCHNSRFHSWDDEDTERYWTADGCS